jgi:tetratricopeptide (TPR) repeat protein
MKRVLLSLLLWCAGAKPQYAGSSACRPCHMAKFESQAKTGHAKALSVAAPGAQGQWAFGAGAKATTWVSQKGEDTLVEHGLSRYSSTKAMGLTPGHDTAVDVVYRMFDPVGTALRCFRCHSTGPVKLSDSFQVSPSEPGIHCEACHGAGAAHVKASGAVGTIGNPKKLRTAELNTLCGACHRQASELDDDTDWGNAWNVRHQPSYLHRAACFRNSNGALSCVTCHNPHEPLKTVAAGYDAKCGGCHKAVTHKTAVAGRACVDCHMPQVTASAALKFTNHWIGIYEGKGNPLTPSRRAVNVLRAAPSGRSGAAYPAPSDPATLAPVYEKALALRGKQYGSDDPRVLRSASELGLFLKETGNAAAAEGPLRRAAALGDADRENLAAALEAIGKREEAFAFYRQAAGGLESKVAARAWAAMARLDAAHADTDYRNAVAAEERASGKVDRRVAVLLHELALALREKGDDRGAEPELRRALAIQEALTKPDQHLTVAVLNTLGNLLEGAGRFDEAEGLERRALRIAEEKFGPESSELSMTCTNLADVLWNRKDFPGAAVLFRRAIAADTALHGADTPETAANVANLGMLLREAGDKAGDALLRQALAVYEKTLGPRSDQAKFVRQKLTAK